jgi:hypothetical protein
MTGDVISIRVVPYTPSKCTCPTVVINAIPGQVSEDQQRKVAEALFAMVELITDPKNESGRTVFGKHRTDCPCVR